jgi:hypothetical protein
MSSPKAITREDILPFDDYAASRKERKKALTAVKKDRRMEVGPHATFYFESYETMWNQIHEMLYIERGGENQIPDELAAYNPLIPQGRELIATVMFEIGDADRRAKVLATLGGVEETIFVIVGDDKIMGVPEIDVDRTNADGKASSVQFVHFPFTDAQAEAFANGSVDVSVGFGHTSYTHTAGMPGAVRTALSKDLD